VIDPRRRVSVVAIALAVGGLVLAASWAGWGAVHHAVADVHPGWPVLVVGLLPVAVAGYAVAYRAWMRDVGVAEIDWPRAWRIVVAGFGPHTFSGGFGLDHRLLRLLGTAQDKARRAVLGLGAVEYAALAPLAWAAAGLLVLAHSHAVQGALLWSWLVATPIGFALGLWWAGLGDRARRRPGRLRDVREAVCLLRGALARPDRHAACWLGMIVYWGAEIATLYAAARTFGVTLGPAHAALAYATGYVLTRRSLPLGGAGAMEILLCLALEWVGVPLAHAVPIVATYRAANLLLPTIPALVAHVEINQRLSRRSRTQAP
jgi:uncharacterized membrane protein YbhN (UPF0104 family)